MLFKILGTTLYYTQGRAINISHPVDIHRGITVLTGPNGSGKSTFAHIIESGRNFRTNRIVAPNDSNPVVKYMEFNDVHSWTGASVGYYQQRYETGMNDEVPTVADIMGFRANTEMFDRLSMKLNLKDALYKKINHLSSGELRKLLIINALHDNPNLLILDNPFIGLDRVSREVFVDSLQTVRDSGVSVMLLLSNPAEAPKFTDNFLFADNFTISSTLPVGASSTSRGFKPFPFNEDDNFKPGEPIIKMQKCKVHYGNVKVLDDVDWEVYGGQRWSVSGPNGSGKSTLLSLIYADNPKSYSNNMELFGRKRGTGESIWDIKRRIGFVSPEMQLYFKGNGTVEHIVANGLNDAVGLFVKPTPQQVLKARQWLEHFRILHLADRQFSSLSSGERQLVLVARSIIKEPQLLILDEPMHGLDPANRDIVVRTIEDFLQAHPCAAFIMVTHNPGELPPSINNHLNLTTTNNDTQ